MKNLRWYELSDRMNAQGAIKHKVWRANGKTQFYAQSGLDAHGPYQTAQEARRACEAIEIKENS